MGIEYASMYEIRSKIRLLKKKNEGFCGAWGVFQQDLRVLINSFNFYGLKEQGAVKSSKFADAPNP